MILEKKNIKIVNDIIDVWINSKSQIKVQSYQRYERLITVHIEKTMGKYKLKKLTGIDIKKYFNELELKKVSTSVQKTIFYILHSSLQIAMEKRLCNPINFKEVNFKYKQIEINILSKKEQIRLEYELMKNDNIRKICLLLTLYTGLRIGELSGLKWSDIDFLDQCLYVKRTVSRIKYSNGIIKTKLVVGTPKSNTSSRCIPIPKFLIELLKKYRSHPNYFILSNSTNIYDPRLMEYFYVRIMKKCGIKYTNFHTMRHTFATRSIESGMDIKALSEILGHSSVQITLKIYVHPTKEYKRKSLENLVKFMSIKK
ncbi:MAG: site-specific integrase [Clostridium sp.]|nr:site-specific integrase [Clostridium sp.]MCM1443853.1 site-specific integrase [Candidatus Amulumruptor caecigallinarius]